MRPREPEVERRDLTRRFRFQEFMKVYEEDEKQNPETYFETFGPEKENLCSMWKQWRDAEQATGWKEE